MRFPIEVHDTEVSQLVLELMRITGIKPWEKRFEWLTNEINENSHMESWLRERCGLELTLKEALANGNIQQGNRFDVQTIEHYELVAFMAGVTRIFKQLSPVGQNRLRGVILDGLNTDKGLSSVQHEITTAVHLMSRGFDVEFHDLDCEGGVDFIARKEGIEIEVECKMFSADIGRKIHRRRSATLFKAFEGVINQIYRTATCGLIVRITIPDRLTPSPSQHQGILKTLTEGLFSGGEMQSEYCSVKVCDFSIVSSPFSIEDKTQFSQRALKQFVQELTGRSNATIMSMFEPNKRAIVIMIESAKLDNVLSGMRRQFKEAAVGQFSKVRPAFLAAQLHDLTDVQLLDIAKSDSSSYSRATGLQRMTSDLLQSESRAHVHTIVYRAHGKLSPEGGVIGSSGITYLMKNASHPLANDSRYAVFSDPARSNRSEIIQNALKP